jgi:hypothetical protein
MGRCVLWAEKYGNFPATQYSAPAELYVSDPICTYPKSPHISTVNDHRSWSPEGLFSMSLNSPTCCCPHCLLDKLLVLHVTSPIGMWSPVEYRLLFTQSTLSFFLSFFLSFLILPLSTYSLSVRLITLTDSDTHAW